MRTAGSSADLLTASELAQHTLQRRAVEAAIWGVPIVSVDAMRQAFFRDAGAMYNDIVYWSKPADWKNQTTTPNASSLYVYFNYNLKDGTLVLEFPPAEGAGLFGSIVDAWQVPTVDVGPEGEDRGQGGKYLLLRPDFTGEPPAGYIPVRSATYNGYALFRAIPATQSDEDVARALALVKRLRLYPFAKATRPPQQRHIDMAGRLFHGIVHYDDTFYDSLARILNEEPVQERDLVAMGELRSLGIEKGKEFAPTATTRALLDKAVTEAHQTFMEAATRLHPYWPDARWGMSVVTGPKTGFTFQTGSYLDVDERGGMYFMAYAPPKKLGAASFYLGSVEDASGAPLHGSSSYRLRIPAHVPVRQFWAVTVYDLTTASFIHESPKVSIDSYQQTETNADGSLDVFFGPEPPAGRQANWIYTARGRRWFAFFRFYGPDTAVFDKSWRLPDIEKLP